MITHELHVLTQQVREAIAEADASGQRRPGRPALVRLTGAKEHEVRQALTTVRYEYVHAPPAVPGTSERAPERGSRAPTAWPLLLIAIGAAVSIWSGWVGLGQLTGFGLVEILPGLLDGLRINTAVVLPLSVEAYGAYALRCWLSTAALSPRTRTFARRSAITSLALGALAQIVYHLLTAAHIHTAPWPVTILVATVPVAVLGLASALARLVTNDHQATQPDHPARE